jgi:hypothetical protein
LERCHSSTSKVNQSIKIMKEFAEFTENADYKTERETLPWIQSLNKSDAIERAGWFISEENTQKAGLTLDSNWEAHKQRFGTSDPVSGFRTITPNFSVIHTSPLFMRLRQGEDLTLKPFVKSEYDASKYTCVTRYLLLFLDPDNKPLHYTPVQFTAKGSVCGSMAGELRKIHEEINKIVGSQMGARFFALWRHALSLDTVMKGTKQSSSWVTAIAGHEQPTGKAHFFGTDKELRTIVETLFDQYKDFSKLQKERVPNTELEDEEIDYRAMPF